MQDSLHSDKLNNKMYGYGSLKKITHFQNLSVFFFLFLFFYPFPLSLYFC